MRCMGCLGLVKSGYVLEPPLGEMTDGQGQETMQVCGRWNKDDLVCETGAILNGPSSCV
jgi:hypothetical protein